MTFLSYQTIFDEAFDRLFTHAFEMVAIRCFDDTAFNQAVGMLMRIGGVRGRK
jgi:hypothetical protein